MMDTKQRFHRNSKSKLLESRLTPYLDAYKGHLIERRYTAGIVSTYLGCITHFARWLNRSRLDSLAKRRISPHTIRHATAMSLLQSGVAFNVIALWLGHESTTTTHRYVEADLAMKEKALARLQEPDTKMRRFHPKDSLMRFLQTL